MTTAAEGVQACYVLAPPGAGARDCSFQSNDEQDTHARPC